MGLKLDLHIRDIIQAYWDVVSGGIKIAGGSFGEVKSNSVNFRQII
jgi:hypothetical protein